MDDEIISEADGKCNSASNVDQEDISTSDESVLDLLTQNQDELVQSIHETPDLEKGESNVDCDNAEDTEDVDIEVEDVKVIDNHESENEVEGEGDFENSKNVTSIPTNRKSKSEQSISNDEKEPIVNGKKKIKEGKPFSKVVVRRLPATMTREIFLDQVSPLPQYDYFYFVSSSHTSSSDFSRAYLNFLNQDDLFDFTRTFDNYVFVDAKGHEYPAVVEFAPYQRVPKRTVRKKDSLTGTIENDPTYITFKEHLLAEAIETSKSAGSIKQHYFETEISENEEVKTTPLLEFLKARRAKKVRLREEKKEERKRKEAERKLLKQKMKEKLQEQHQEQEDVSEVKVLQAPKEKKDKEIKKTKLKEKDEKIGKPESRTREFKNKGGKSYKEERLKQAERREEKKKKENEETKEGTEEVAEEEEIKDDSSSWVEKRKWKGESDGSVKGTGARTFRRREEKKRESGYERRRGKACRINTAGRKDSLRDGSGQLVDTEKQSPLSESTSHSPNVNTSESQSTQVMKSETDKKLDNIDSKPTKDPRVERRIRNKDRPSIEIYRPGMGKFSRQRLEKEKTVGSADESPCHSPSPTPNTS